MGGGNRAETNAVYLVPVPQTHKVIQALIAMKIHPLGEILAEMREEVTPMIVEG